MSERPGKKQRVRALVFSDISDSCLMLCFCFMDLRSHVRFATTCLKTLRVSGITTPAPYVWQDKLLKLNLRVGPQLLLHRLTSTCKGATILTLFNCEHILSPIALCRLTTLTTLSIDHTNLELDLVFLKHTPCMRKLRLVDNNLTDLSLEALKDLFFLEDLCLRLQTFTGEGLKWFKDLHALRELDLGYSIIDSNQFEDRLLLLKNLRLRKINLDFTPVHNLAFAKEMNTLREVSLCNCISLDDEVFDNLQAVPLENINLVGCVGLTGNKVDLVAPVFKAKTLRLSMLPRLTDLVFLPLSEMSMLRELAVEDCELLTSHCLVYISSLPHLSVLKIKGCNNIVEMSSLTRVLDKLTLSSMSNVDWTSLAGVRVRHYLMLHACQTLVNSHLQYMETPRLILRMCPLITSHDGLRRFSSVDVSACSTAEIFW